MNIYMNAQFFKDLPKSTVKSIENVAIYRSYTPKTYITVEGKPCEAVYLVVAGTLNIIRTSANGRKLVLQRLGPGDWFNAVSCIKFKEDNLYSARAITPVKALILSVYDFRRLLQEQPLFTLKILENLSDRIAVWIDQMENLGLRSTNGRVAAFLLEHCDESSMIYWQCTQSDIADRLGTVADVVGRILRKFSDDRLIEIPADHCIVIVDREGLKEESLN